MAITLEQVTNKDESGIFDLLLVKVQKHLDEQFQLKRLTGQQYAEVYLANMSNVLSQSIQFATTIETANNQAELIKAQVDQVRAEIELSESRLLLAQKELDKADKELLLMEAKLDLAAKELEQADKALLKADKELALMEEQLLTAGVEKLLIEAKVRTEKAQTEDLLGGSVIGGVIGKQIDVMEEQVVRSQRENELIQAKVNTEKAQIVDEIEGAPVAGVVGKQKALFDAQKSGFARDAEQKLLKIFVDAWSVDKSTDPDAIDRNLTGLYDTNIKQVVDKALEGIGTTSVGLTP